MRRLYAFLTALAIVVSCMAPMTVVAGATGADSVVATKLTQESTSALVSTGQFAGGSGTEADPYLIETKEHLNNVRNNLAAHYKMISDITFTEEDFAVNGNFYNSGKGWIPIDTFTGVFDGNGHSIQNLFFDIDETRNYAGLFSSNAGIIRNLSVENVDFTAAATYTNLNRNVAIAVGAIAGHSSGTISNCYTSGKIQAIASFYGTSTSSTYTADVCSGGIVGYLSASGCISNSYNMASVIAKSTASQPTPCAGGLVGESQGTVSHSYNVGTISSNLAGGIVGNLSSSGSIVSCFYSEKCAKGVGNGVDTSTKCSLEDMTKAETFIDFDFTRIWMFNNGRGYPYPILQEGVVPTLLGNTTEFAGGNGFSWNPYLIASKEHLNNVRNYLDASFKLICDIEFDDNDFKPGGAYYNSGKGWRPIGEHWTSPFVGVLDGNGKSIVNLQISDAINTDRDTGLVGYNSGTIKNLTIADSIISSVSYPSNIGCIVGQNGYHGVIENCSTVNSKLISSAGKAMGGIVGLNEGVIRDCSNQTSITSDKAARIGGICGTNDGGGSLIGLIQRCTNEGKITVGAPSQQGARVGGIAGHNNSEGVIEQSANTGDISVNAKSALVGGIAGELHGTIQQCYNTGCVDVTTSSTVYAGGILGLNESGIILDSYNTASVSGTCTGYSGELFAGGIVGKHKSILDTFNCYTLGSVTGTGSASTYVGYVCGYNATSTIENCHYLGIPNNGSGFGDTASMYGHNVEILKSQSTYSTFDFESIWSMSGNNDYPFPELSAVPMVYEKEIISISVDSMPTKLKYIQNYELLNVTGGTLRITYEYDEYEVIPLSEATLSGFDNSVVGQQSITVSYFNHKTEFEIEIMQKCLERIEVTALPNKTTYYEGEVFDPNGLIVIAHYNDESFANITGYSISGFSSTPGKKTITVQYQGMTDTFDVTVIKIELVSIEITTKPNKTTYYEGEVFDPNGLIVIAHYNDESFANITGYSISGFSSTPGKKTITVQYRGMTDTFDVTVIKAELVSIEITSKPNKLVYLEGETFDKAGMVITAYYNNNTNAVITDYNISGYSSTPGSKVITVTHGGKTATFAITVNARIPSSVTSSKYTVSAEHISKITAGTTVTTLLSSLNERAYCKVFKGSSEASGTLAVGTGMIVKIMDGNTVKATYTVIVTGDINGDGKITVTDMLSVKAHLLKKSNLQGVYAQAADTNGDSNVSITDFIQLKAHVLGKSQVEAQ